MVKNVIALTKAQINGWLKESPIADTTKKQYLCQVKMYCRQNHSILAPSKVKDFLVDGAQKRVYIRKSALISLLKYLDERGFIDYEEDYLRVLDKIKYSVKERRNMQTATYAEVSDFVSQIKASNPKLALIVMIAFDTGARIRAILKLRKEDLKVIGGQPFLFLRDKRQVTDMKPITHETHSALLDFIKKGRVFYLFMAKKRVSMQQLDKEYRRLWSQLKNETRRIYGSPGWSWHWIRRGAGVYWFQKTRNLRAVQEFLGHENPGVTSKYLKLSGEQIKKMFAKETRQW
ncbi:MAG: hypothetical protein DRP42_03255 [Tenericutes bacterium]|nr:MAG: hypothetical protein DRP42_03255 [Mycoplasmatota bacterium]